jgi:3-hydroxy acid dehydrogenase / malonic semialdehyde reductase
VTGTSRGIGRALAVELAERGARVLAATRDCRRAPAGDGLVPVGLDLGSFESIEGGCDALAEELPRVDVLVNNAGAFTGDQLERQDVEDIYNLFQVNLTGLVHLTRRLLPLMLERGSGKIVNHASLVGYFHFPGISTYSASKAGVTAFTSCLRRELEHTGVTTLEVVTGGVDTNMLRGAAEQLDEQTESSGWQWMEPAEWASRIADAIEEDKRVLEPPGRARVGKALSALPPFVLDAVSSRGFERS